MASSPKLISPNDDAVSPTKKPQPIPWTHQETVNLIRAYQEKWYSFKRGPLRSSQWEEVAVVVAARCGYDLNHPSKSAVQCRHKMEKLRQRHRAEKHRLADGATPGRAWQYFGLMDELERGPMPISARPLMALLPADDDRVDNYNYDDDNENYDDEEDLDNDNERKNYVKSKSINYIIRQRPRTNKYGGFSGFERERVPKGFWRMDDNDDDEDDVSDDDDNEDEEEEKKEEDKRVVVDERGLVLGLTAEIKDFGQRFTAMENLKMRMMKETERRRLEMENKRMELILKSQRRIVDSIERAFGSSKKMKISYDI